MFEGIWSTGFAVAHAVLAGIWITPLVILWFVSLCVVRQRGDPARVGVAWIKAVYPFWIFSMLCQVVQVGLNIWMNADHASTRSITEDLQSATHHIFFAARALQNIADILLFVTFVELGGGFLLCLNGGQKTLIRRYLRFMAFTWAVVLLTLAVTLLGIRTEADNTYKTRMMVDPIEIGPWLYSSSDGEAWEWYWQFVEDAQQAYMDQLVNISRLHTALNICLWITSLPALAFASYVLHKSKGNIMLKKATTLYLVSTVLTFCRLLVTMAIYMSEYNSDVVLGFNGWYIAYTDIRTPILPLIEAFFNFVLMFIVLTLLFIVVIRKRRGLWSKSQMTWEASNKLANVTTGSSPTSETPCYSDDGLQEHGFCLQPQRAELSSLPIDLQPIHQPCSPTAAPSSPASPQQEPIAVHQDAQPVSPHKQHTIPRRPLAPSVPHSPTEPGSPSNTTTPPQEAHQPDGRSMRRQRIIEQWDAQKVLLPDGPPIHHPQLMSSDDEGGVADGFQMQTHEHSGAEQRATNVVAAKFQTAQDHNLAPEVSTELDMVADGFQMQNSEGARQRRVEDVKAAKFQKIQDHGESTTESDDVVADGFQMQDQGSSELPSYTESGGETTTTRTGFGYLREKDDQDKKARGRARSF